MQILPTLRAGNRHDIVGLGEHPREGELCRRAMFLARQFFHPLYHVEIALEIFPLKSRRRSPVIVGWQVLEALEFPGEKTTAQRRVRDKANSQFAARGQDAVVLRIARPERVFRLHGSNGMDRVGAANRLCARLRQAEEPHFTCAHQLGHRANRLFNRRIRIDAMLVIEIDYLYVESLQTGFARRAHVIRSAADAAVFRPIWIAQDPELCRDNGLLAATAQRAADQLLVRVRSVNICRIKEIDAQLERAVNRCDRFLLAAPLAVKVRHAHAAKSNRRNDWSTAAEFSLFHFRFSCAQNDRIVFPVPRSMRPILFARKIDIARFASRSLTIATMPMPMLKT